MNPGQALVVDPSSFLVGQKGVIAQKPFERGQSIFVVTGPVVSERTIYTFPLSLNRHVDPRTETGEPTLGHFLNHSCTPNAYVKIIKQDQTEYIEILARQDILPGQEVTIDYALMEYTVAAQGVRCLCQTPDCQGYLMGYKDLSQEQKEKYQLEGIVADYLLELDKI